MGIKSLFLNKMKIIISGCGSYLPEKILTNFDLAKLVDTNHDWIKSRTGIDKRHIAATGQLSSDLAVIAAERAIEDAGIDKSQIDLVIVATSTPDLTMPSTACIIHQKLKSGNKSHQDNMCLQLGQKDRPVIFLFCSKR